MPREIPGRKPRADAERNRQRLLKVAKKAFAAKGTSASLEEIARVAGVGIGTLYRHFPTRQALVDAMFQDKGDQLAEAAERLSQELPPVDALHKWLLLFVNYLANKEIMAEVLNCLTGSSDRICTLSGEKLVETLDALLERARNNGDIAMEIEPLDLLCAIAGIASFVAEENWESSAKRLVGVTIAGLRSSRGRRERLH